MSRSIDINVVIRMLNTLDRYTSTELTLCDTDKIFPKNEVFVVDDVYEGLDKLSTIESEPTYEQIQEYCHKRCLSIVDNALLNKYAQAEMHPEPCEDQEGDNK